MHTKNVPMNEDLSSLIILKSLTFNDAWPSQLPWLKKKAYSSDEMQIFLVKALTLNLLHNCNQITSFSPRSGALNVIFPSLRNLSFLSLFIFPLKIFSS